MINRMILVPVLLTVWGATSARTQDWSYDASAYFWLAGMEGTIGIGFANTEPVEASFSDLASHLDFAAAGHFEARNPSVVLIGDFNYVGFGASREATVARQPVTVDMDLNQWIFELGGGYRITPNIDLLVVGRLYTQATGTTATSILGTTAGETDATWGDVYAGVRYARTFGDRWLFSVRGDVGVGGSDLALYGNVFAGYQWSTLFSTGLDYRTLSLDYSGGEGSEYYMYDMTTAGAGLVFRFTF